MARNLINLIFHAYPTLFHGSPKYITTAPHIASSDTRALNLMNAAVHISKDKSESVQLRFSGHVLDVPLIGAPTSFVSEWGEEKRRQPQRAEQVLCCKPVSTKERWQLIAEHTGMGGFMRNRIYKISAQKRKELK